MLNLLALSLKQLWREWRAGEWLMVSLALLLAITAITSIHFYTDRLMRGLENQSAKFLGGDLVVSSSLPIPNQWVIKANDLKLNTAQVWSYPSVVTAKNRMQLVNLQAVSDEYPLIGSSNLSLESHHIWVEPRLLPLLAINFNDTVTVGAADFKVKEKLTSDVDMLNTGFVIAPRVMMRLSDVPATRTVIAGSRVDYRLLLTGNKLSLEQFRLWVQPQLRPGQTLIDAKSQRFALINIMQRVENYLYLILLFCLMMSGVSIILSMNQYLHRHYLQVGLWRCLGARRRQLIQVFLIQLFVIALLTGLVGIVAGYLAQTFFVYLFRNYIQFPLPPAGFSPIVMGFIISNLLLFAFAYPVISALSRTSPLYVWREEINTKSASLISLSIAFLLIVLFIYWTMGYSILVFYFCYGLIFSIAILFLLSRLMLTFLMGAVKKLEGTLRSGINQLVRHPKSISIQFIGFNLILIALITSGLLRNDLINSWRQMVPQSAPNYFAFNIAHDDVINLKKMFLNKNIQIEGIYPIVRGRLTELNGKPILQAVPENVANHNALHRDLNLSWMWEFPSDNKIVSGKSWSLQDAGRQLVSVEWNLAQDLKLSIGDELSFQIADKKIRATIINFRSLVWSSIHPNFFMIFPPGLLDNFPETYITSFYLNPDQTIFLNELINQFPNITVIDVASLVKEMQDLIGKIIIGMQYLFLFALGLGVLIFLASLQASMDERRKTYFLLHIIGAEKNYIRKSLSVEFFTLASSIAVSSFLLSYLMVYLLERYIFNIS